MSTPDVPLEYGWNGLWVTPVRLRNLLKEGVVDRKLHAWLEEYAEDPRFATKPVRAHYEGKSTFMRYDMTVFSPPAHPEIARIKEIMLAESDEFARETLADPLPEHEKLAYFWFVVQHPNNLEEEIRPHYHEGGDVALVYYLSTPSNDSGAIVLYDPRGPIERGARAFPRHETVLGFTPKRGDLLVIPRYVMHRTTVNTDKHNRKVIGAVVAYDRPRQVMAQYVERPPAGAKPGRKRR